MAPKRRLDEKRKLQNREAQRRFRERAKLRNGTTKRNSEGSSEKESESPENIQNLNSFSNTYLQKDDLNPTSTFIQSIFQTASLDSIGGNDSLQNALMASLTQLNKEMDRCDKEDILKYTTAQGVDCERRESSTSGSSISIDSTSPSESNYSSTSNQSSSSTSNWLGLNINEANPVDLIGVNDFNTEDWSQLMEQIVDPASLELPVEMQQDSFSLPEIEILPQSQTMILASPKRVDTAIVQTTQLPSPTGAGQLLLPRLYFMQSAQLNADKLGLTFDYLHNCHAISTIGEGWSRFRKQSRLDIGKIDPLKALQMSKSQYEIVAYAANAPDISHLIENKIRKSLRNGPTALQTRSENEWTWENVSENMKPTDIQLSVEHHPYIDVAFPWKSMRDKIILLSEILFEPQNLCIAAMYGDQATGEQAFKIWGDDPSNEMTWEISESFIHQWWFLIDKSILRQTNWWRRQRGEKPIVEEKIV